MHMSEYTHRTQRTSRNQQLKVIFLNSNVSYTRAEVQVTTSKTERNLFHFLAEALVHVIADVGEWIPKTVMDVF